MIRRHCSILTSHFSEDPATQAAAKKEGSLGTGSELGIIPT